MSAIYGIYFFDEKAVTTQDLQIMKQPLHHWETDGEGVWINGAIGLGNLLLHNTPESKNEKLPHFHSLSELCITSDARIDNRDDLYQLLGLNPIDQTIPDSELILLTYEKFGNHCTNYLIGDFSFVIWNKKKQELFCVRDQMGVKPFFYYVNDRFFAFASEKKGLLSIPGIDTSINQQFFYNHLIITAEQHLDQTLYQKIKRLPPAHQLTITKENKPTLHQYWDLDATKEIHFPNASDYYEAFKEKIELSIKCRIRTSYPIGVELSGGMDSSGITGVAAKFLKKNNQELISISNSIPRNVTDPEILNKSERKWIDAVVEFNQIQQSIITESTFEENLFSETDFSLYVDDGLENWDQKWQMPIRKSAREAGIRTLLSGFPGDEMVTYRGKYYMLDYLDKKQYFKYWTAKKKFWGFYKIEPFLSYETRYQIHLLKNKLGIYNKQFNRIKDIINIPAENRQHLGDANWLATTKKEQYNSYRHYQKHRYLRNHVANRMESETRYGLYFGLEPRFPYADIRLTQFYLSLPNHLKYEGTLNRTAYRKAMKEYLPPILLDRDDKTGTMAPFRKMVMDETLKKAFVEKRTEELNTFMAKLNGHPLLKRELKQGDRLSLNILRWLSTNRF